ncbi:uncharacterized protein LACBIDRAFT_333740 [Laccaria bicolor S238N-H82]|uniref:Predicted protein n=1 Tax=Laccaria bicolor (strain S238N-H82 / ATCC MYA-4686) TaxID=486041 RepID=B0DWX1_LACBS|nr:uncharacterized protein LACBIDRAFT_333740 [Laccaria bicolor S238N-H82]EDR00836.1 predicted protein [Laccaria bicolor S238N-H82]|eukprot:XP_001888430.1 predicted protein [Laccaria bicolor S238N-H82]
MTFQMCLANVDKLWWALWRWKRGGKARKRSNDEATWIEHHFTDDNQTRQYHCPEVMGRRAVRSVWVMMRPGKICSSWYICTSKTKIEGCGTYVPKYQKYLIMFILIRGTAGSRNDALLTRALPNNVQSLTSAASVLRVGGDVGGVGDGGEIVHVESFRTLYLAGVQASVSFD